MDGTLLRLQHGDGDAVLRNPGVVDSSRKRRERGSVECESGELGGERRVWSLRSKRVKRGGDDGDGFCVHGRIVEAVLRNALSDDGTHRIDAEVESSWPRGGGCFDRSGGVKPLRFMYFERGDWVEYPDGANSVAWERFRAGDKTAEVVVESRVYLLRFGDMTQVNLATGYVRSIAWIGDGWEVSLPANPIAGPRGKSLSGNRHRTTSWRDGATDSISSFILGSGGAQGCELERHATVFEETGDHELTKLTLGGYGGGLCKTEQDVKSGFEERATSLGNTSGLVPIPFGQRFVKLEEGKKEFDEVKSKFLSGFGKLADGTTISGIYRDSSPVAVARQEAFERQKALTEQARGDANVRFGWHGTSKKGVVGIFTHGFGQPKTPKNGSAYGVGVYLALENQSFVSAVYADNDEDGEQHVVLCQIIAGASELVKPPSEQFHPSSEHYDSGVDDLIAPKRLIIWSTHMNTHILPLYVVSFKLPPRWHCMMAALNGKQRSSFMFCQDVSAKNPCFAKQTCVMAETLRHKAWGTAEALRKNAIGSTNHHQGPTSAFIRFPQLFALLGRLLSPEQRLALKNCYVKYEAGSMSRRTLVQEIQRMVGRDCLIHAIQMCQGFQGSHTASVIEAQ